VAKWTLIYSDRVIAKDGVGYDCVTSEDGSSQTPIDMSWLPASVLAIQSLDGVTCTIENGSRDTEVRSSNDEDVATSSLSWWSNLEAAWQTAHDAQLALDAWRDAQEDASE